MIADASGARVVPRFGPAIETRYCDPRRASGTVIAKLPFALVLFAPQRTHPGTPQPEQSKKPARRTGVPAFVGDVPVTARPWKVARPWSTSVRPDGIAASVICVGAPRQREKRSSTAFENATCQVWSAHNRPSGVRRSTRRYGSETAVIGRLTSGPERRPPGRNLPAGGTSRYRRLPPELQLTSAFPFASTRSAGRWTFVAVSYTHLTLPTN